VSIDKVARGGQAIAFESRVAVMADSGVVFYGKTSAVALHWKHKA